MALEVYTARMGYRGPDWLDVSLQGNDKRTEPGGHRGIGFWFAPPPSLLYPFLSARRHGRETPEMQAQYRTRYLAHLRERYRGPTRAAFDTLLAWPRVVLLCFCEPGEFCHRRLLASEVLVRLGAVDRGELAAGAEPLGPPFWISPAAKRERAEQREAATVPLRLEPPPGVEVRVGESSGRCSPFTIMQGGKAVGGGTICGGKRKPRCKGSPSCVATSGFLCDFPLRGAKRDRTCDLPLCGSCAVKMGPDRHYCPSHAALDPTGAMLVTK